MTRMPRWRLSATFSAACRQTLQVRKRLSPSFHSPDCWSRKRGVEATRNVATACPLGVKRSSGSATRLPTIVIWVSPAAMRLSGYRSCACRGLTGRRSVGLGADDLGAQDGLLQVQLPVELFDRRGRGRQVD